MFRKSLDDDEKEIFDLVKSFTQKKAIVQLIELITHLDNKLRLNQNFNRNKIEKIVKTLIKKKLILIGTKLTKDDILTVPIRKEIFHFITENPGVNINDIKREFDIGSNQAIWHINMLNDFDFIKIKQIKNQKALFNKNINECHEETLFYLRNEMILKLIKYLEGCNEPQNPTQISDILEIHYNTTKKYLETLLKLDLIKKLNGNKKKRYSINLDLYKKIKNIFS